MDEPKRTQKALRGCAEWLVECLRLGWRREDLDFMEELWWRHHNHRGELVSKVIEVERIAVSDDQSPAIPEARHQGKKMNR
jgi:hypothetical protein